MILMHIDPELDVEFVPRSELSTNCVDASTDPELDAEANSFNEALHNMQLITDMYFGENNHHRSSIREISSTLHLNYVDVKYFLQNIFHRQRLFSFYQPSLPTV